MSPERRMQPCFKARTLRTCAVNRKLTRAGRRVMRHDIWFNLPIPPRHLLLFGQALVILAPFDRIGENCIRIVQPLPLPRSLKRALRSLNSVFLAQKPVCAFYGFYRSASRYLKDLIVRLHPLAPVTAAELCRGDIAVATHCGIQNTGNGLARRSWFVPDHGRRASHTCYTASGA